VTEGSRNSPRHPRESGDPAFLMDGWVHLLANRYCGAIYAGVTSDLARRTWQHREKAIKKGRRQWKIELIEGRDPDWRDRFDELIGL
jgi:putative endonuclease